MKTCTPSTSRPRILIADDHAILAETLRVYLETTFSVIGVVGDGRAMVQEAIRLRPDLIVADFAMPLLNGLRAPEELGNKYRLQGSYS